MRGKPTSVSNDAETRRITPAGAGKTYCILCAFRVYWDHPRRCGENLSCPTKASISPGSPPQVRGKPPMFPNKHFRHRITPAGAGKTFTAVYAKILTKDHPRRCGENSDFVLFPTFVQGSPPQVRGKPPLTLVCGVSLWITPAGAGKTRSARNNAAAYKDHPRRCGENSTRHKLVSYLVGSPPQVRGKPFRI